MTNVRKISAALGLATLATLGLAVAQPAHAQVSGFGSFATPNGTATYPTSSTLQLTSSLANQAGSAFTSTKQSITNFTTSFTYQDITGNHTLLPSQFNQADGWALVLQNVGTNALGANGGDLGYGHTNTPVGNIGTSPSAAIEAEMYQSSTTGYDTNGSVAGKATNNLATGSNPLYWYYGDQINVNISYNGTNIYESLVDTTTGASKSYSYTANLANVLGSTTAYVGFTGGAGGSSSTQQISNFSYTSTYAAAAPIAISGLNADVIENSQGETSANSSTFDAKNNFVFYSQNENATRGLPAGGTFTSATGSGTTFQIASALGNNALLLSKTPTISTYNFSSTGTITLTTPAKYSTLSFLMASTNGAAPLSVQYNYATGASSTSVLATNDWFGNANPAISAGRKAPGATTFDNAGTTGPFLYEATLSADPTRTLTSISFTDLDTSTTDGTVAGIFAISGVAAAPEPGEIAGMLMGGLGLLGLIARKRRVNA